VTYTGSDLTDLTANWFFFAASWASGTPLKIYVNTNMKSSTTNTGDWTPGATLSNLELGGFGSYGWLHDIALFDYRLSDEQLAALADHGTTSTGTPTPTAPPPDTNLARNGDFATDTVEWNKKGDVSATVTGGVLNLYRQPPYSTDAVLSQDMNVPVLSGSSLEVKIDLGNSSSVTKRMFLYLHRPDWGNLMSCTFELAPNTSLATYTLRGRTSIAWANMRLELWPYPPDNLPAILVDNVDVQYKPGLNPVEMECVSPDINLARNGNFAAGADEWSLYGEVSATVMGGVMNLYRQAPSPNGAALFQDMNVSTLHSSPLEVKVDLGNSSSVTKQMTLHLHNPDSSEVLSCNFSLAPNTSLATYTLRGWTSYAWANMRLELRPDPADDLPAILVDNVDVHYKPGINSRGPECITP
jgi:hypothetical protein